MQPLRSSAAASSERSSHVPVNLQDHCMSCRSAHDANVPAEMSSVGPNPLAEYQYCPLRNPCSAGGPLARLSGRVLGQVMLGRHRFVSPHISSRTHHPRRPCQWHSCSEDCAVVTRYDCVSFTGGNSI